MAALINVLNEFYARVWEQADVSAVPQFFGTSSQPLKVPTRPVEPEEIAEWMYILHQRVRDIKVRPVTHIEDDPWVSAVYEVSCVSQDDGVPVTVYSHVMTRFENGLIVESYPHFDFLRFFEQLGQLPPDSYALLMGGHSLR